MGVVTPVGAAHMHKISLTAHLLSCQMCDYWGRPLTPAVNIQSVSSVGHYTQSRQARSRALLTCPARLRPTEAAQPQDLPQMLGDCCATWP